jgi:hypothetical protein
MNPDKIELRAYFGHHKCASTWIHQILNEACQYMGLRHLRLSNTFSLETPFSRWVAEQHADVLSYTNADFQQAKELFPLRGFHVIRDPRDILVSGYFSHRNSHQTDVWSELVPHREALQRVSKEEGLLLEIEFSRRFFVEMEGWDLKLPEVLTCRMEDLTSDPLAGFKSIFNHLGLLSDHPSCLGLNRLVGLYNRIISYGGLERHLGITHQLTEASLKRILERHAFARKTKGRHPGEEDINSHYRKGIPGDWLNHFTPALAEAFASEYGPLLIKLGYEEDQQWTKLPQSSSQR